MALDQNLSRVYKVANQVFALNPTGELFEILNGRLAKLNLPASVGALHEIAPQQTYEFLEAGD